MRTPKGVSTVEVLCTGAGECFRVRRHAIIGADGGYGWGPIGQLRFAVDEGFDLLARRVAVLVGAAG